MWTHPSHPDNPHTPTPTLTPFGLIFLKIHVHVPK